MGRLSFTLLILVPAGLFLLLAGYLLDSKILKMLAYAVLFAAGLLICIFIIVPLLILAVGLAYRALKRTWEERKYMLISLFAQTVTAYLSMMINVSMDLGLWPLIGLFALNTFLIINLVGEAYMYTGISDDDSGIAVTILGCIMYGIYVFSLLEELGRAL